MQQDHQTQPSPMQDPQHMAAAMMHGASQMFDMQVTAMRALLKTQASAAAALGFPDYSGVFDGNGTEQQIRQAIAGGAEQWLRTGQQVREAFNDMRLQFVQLAQSQAANAAQTWQQGMQELSSQTEDAMQQLRQATQQQGEQLQRSAEQANQAARDRMHEGAEQLRQSLHEGAQRLQEGSQSAQQGAQGAKSAVQARKS